MSNDRDERRICMLRLRAATHEAAASQLRCAAATVAITRSMRKLADQVQVGFDTELATHPDLAELNVQCDGFYDQA